MRADSALTAGTATERRSIGLHLELGVAAQRSRIERSSMVSAATAPAWSSRSATAEHHPNGSSTTSFSTVRMALFLTLDNQISHTEYTAIGDVNTPASHGVPLPKSAAGNLTDPAGATYFEDVASGDWRLVPATPAIITQGGLDASSSEYGGVTTDFSVAPRTCPTPLTDCYSLGADEAD
jgi:hypothetical protein